MRELFVGIDSGTQSTKALVLDAASGNVVGEGSQSYDLLPDLGPGAKEQDPQTWIDAASASVRAALKHAEARPEEVRAVGVSGQQHGFTPLDSSGAVIRPAKLWCDTSTIDECAILTERLGGAEATIEKIGNAFLPGFTAPKILWLKRHEPENFARLAHVLLPHDYLNFWLTGEYSMEYGDASGTALMDVRSREWSREAVEAIDSSLGDKLPAVQPSDRPVGRVKASLAADLGVTTDTLVSAGGGDNMMGAIGTGATRPSVVTASFGTSGTIYALSENPIVDPRGEIAAFCDSTNRWLPLLCTMNVTVATEMVRKAYGWSHEQLEKAVSSEPVGARGALLLPYLEGERTPNVPDGCGVYLGVSGDTFTPECMARATMEGVTLGMNYGLNRLRALGLTPRQIRVTGGGSKSAVWRQIMADVFDAQTVALSVSEGAAFGAALQALWSWRRNQGEDVAIDAITDQYVAVDEGSSCQPNAENVEVYRTAQGLQDAASEGLRPFFTQRQAALPTLLGR